MRRSLFFAFFMAFLSVTIFSSMSANAAEINRQKVAQWGDPLTPPQSRTKCVSYASGNWPWPATGGWKTCNGWGTDWRHMEVEAFLVFNGPDNLASDAINATGQCAIVAAGAAGVVGIATSGTAAVAAAQPAFISCMKIKGIQEFSKYSVDFTTTSHWTDW